MWIDEGYTSLEDWEALTWSLGCTERPSRSDAREAMTSLTFMLLDVPTRSGRRRGELLVPAPLRHLLGSVLDGLRDVLVDDTEFGVDPGRDGLDPCERLDVPALLAHVRRSGSSPLPAASAHATWQWWGRGSRPSSRVRCGSSNRSSRPLPGQPLAARHHRLRSGLLPPRAAGAGTPAHRSVITLTLVSFEPGADPRPELRRESRVDSGPSGYLVSDADRDSVIDLLRDAVAEGRLMPEEYEERASRALAARTVGDLTPLTADLPVVRPFGPMPAVQDKPIIAVMSEETRSGRWAVPAASLRCRHGRREARLHRGGPYCARDAPELRNHHGRGFDYRARWRGCRLDGRRRSWERSRPRRSGRRRCRGRRLFTFTPSRSWAPSRSNPRSARAGCSAGWVVESDLSTSPDRRPGLHHGTVSACRPYIPIVPD